MKHSVNYVWWKRSGYNFLDFISWLLRTSISLGTTLSLGSLAFSGTFALGLGLWWAASAFVFAIAIEGLVYHQNISATFAKIRDLFVGPSKSVVKHSLAVLKLDLLAKDPKYKDVPILQGYLAQKKALHSLEHQVEEDFQPIDWILHFPTRWKLRRKIQQHTAALRDIENLFVKVMTQEGDEIPEEYAALFHGLDKHEIKGWIEEQTKQRAIGGIGATGILFFALASALSSFLASYTAIKLGLLAFTTAALPGLLLPLAIFAGVGYSLMLINSLMELCNNRIVADWWQSVRNASLKENVVAFFSNIVSIRFWVLVIAGFAAAATGYTWWVGGEQAIKDMFGWADNIAKWLAIVVGIITIPPTAQFDYVNGMKSIEILMKEQKKEIKQLKKSKPLNWFSRSLLSLLHWVGKVIKLHPVYRFLLLITGIIPTFIILTVVTVVLKRIIVRIYQDIKAWNENTKSHNKWIRFWWAVNPIRLIGYIFSNVFRGGVFTAHVASIGATADKLGALPNWVTIIISAVMELLTDIHYLLHNHDDEDHHHEHKDAPPTARSPLLAKKGLGAREMSLQSEAEAETKSDPTIQLPEGEHDHPDFAGVLLIVPMLVFKFVQFAWDCFWTLFTSGFTKFDAAWINSFTNPTLRSGHTHHGHGEHKHDTDEHHGHKHQTDEHHEHHGHHGHHGHKHHTDAHHGPKQHIPHDEKPPEAAKLKTNTIAKLVAYVATAEAQQQRLTTLSTEEKGVTTKTTSWQAVKSAAISEFKDLDRRATTAAQDALTELKKLDGLRQVALKKSQNPSDDTERKAALNELKDIDKKKRAVMTFVPLPEFERTCTTQATILQKRGHFGCLSATRFPSDSGAALTRSEEVVQFPAAAAA